MKGRSTHFSPFDMQLMIDDGDLMHDDAQMMIDDGKMFTYACVSSLLAGSSVPAVRSGQSLLRYPHRKWHSSASSFSVLSDPTAVEA